MVVLFLDFDGVLNSIAFMKSQSAAGKWEMVTARTGARDWSNMIDPRAIVLLNGVVARTGAKIVVSSSWRLALTKDEIISALRKRGFRGDVIDATPHCSGEPRSFEIAAWLNHRGAGDVSRFAIVDDDPSSARQHSMQKPSAPCSHSSSRWALMIGAPDPLCPCASRLPPPTRVPRS